MEPEIVQQPEGAVVKESGGIGLEPVLAGLEKRLDALIEARLDAVEARRRQADRERLTERFVAENPDFPELKASGVLEARKRENPLLDDVGAYFAHCLLVERDGHAEALAKVRATADTEAEARALELLRNKRLAQTLNAAPAGAGRGTGPDPELAAPGKFGGINAVLAARLTARRNAAGR